MSAKVVLRPGLTPLADWRAIYRSAKVTLDPVSRADVEAGKAALSAILSGNGLLPPLDSDGGSPSIADLIEKRGELPPSGLLRLFLALKLASLGQGVWGVRWGVVEMLAGFLANDFLPAVPTEEANDRMALARLFGALTGTGEIVHRGRIRPAIEVLREADLGPLTLNPRERSAMLSGTQLSLATALAGLFEAERVFQSALVAAALSIAATGRPDAPLHSRVHRLHRQRGQIEAGAAFRALLGQVDAKAAGDNGAEDQEPGRSTPFRMGACLDLLRQAAAALERAANSVTEDRFVFWQTEELVAGTKDLSSVAQAADQIALALATLADLAQARIAAIEEGADAADSAEGDEAGEPSPNAAVVAAEDSEHDEPAAPGPAGIWRLAPMAAATALVVATEFLKATRAIGVAEQEELGEMQNVLKQVREAAPDGNEIGAIAELVRTGALSAAARVTLPSMAPPQPQPTARRLGGRSKRK